MVTAWPHPWLGAGAVSPSPAPYGARVLGEGGVTDCRPGLQGSNHYLARMPSLVI